jgi:hypothetical protein
MKKQLVLFKPNLLETELVAVLGQLPSEQREVATQLLAELMARSLADNKGERNEGGGKQGADE